MNRVVKWAIKSYWGGKKTKTNNQFSQSCFEQKCLLLINIQLLLVLGSIHLYYHILLHVQEKK